MFPNDYRSTSKASFLKKTRMEKESRLLIKNQKTSIQKIMSFYRLGKQYEKTSNEIISSYSQKFKDFFNLSNLIPQKSVILQETAISKGILKGIMAINMKNAFKYEEFLKNNIRLIMISLKNEKLYKSVIMQVYFKRIVELVVCLLEFKCSKYRNEKMIIEGESRKFFDKQDYPFIEYVEKFLGKKGILEEKFQKILHTKLYIRKVHNLIEYEKDLTQKWLRKIPKSIIFNENVEFSHLQTIIFDIFSTNKGTLLVFKPKIEHLLIILKALTNQTISKFPLAFNDLYELCSAFIKGNYEYLINNLEIFNKIINLMQETIKFNENCFSLAALKVFEETKMLNLALELIKMNNSNEIIVLYNVIIEKNPCFVKNLNLPSFLQPLYSHLDLQFQNVSLDNKSTSYFPLLCLFLNLLSDFMKNAISFEAIKFISIEKLFYNLSSIYYYHSPILNKTTNNTLNELLITCLKLLYDQNLYEKSNFIEEEESNTEIKMESLEEEIKQQKEIKSFKSSKIKALIKKFNFNLTSSQSQKKILKSFPLFFDFQTRFSLFQAKIEKSKKNENRGLDNFVEPNENVISIRRGKEIEDGVQNFKNRNLRSLIKIKFISEMGIEEIGIDGGGLLKEFIGTCLKNLFDPEFGMFKSVGDEMVWPSPGGMKVHDNWNELYEFAGKLVGKALYENILIDGVFPFPFFKRITSTLSNFSALQRLDIELYKNLNFLLSNDDPNIIQSLNLTFSCFESFFDSKYEVELVPFGSNMEVSKGNKEEFIRLISDWKLNKSVELQLNAFYNGLEKVVKLNWLRIFDCEELQILFSGEKGFDIDDLKNNVVLTGFEREDPFIISLWEVLDEMSEEEQRLFLVFVTSCSRPPIQGFGALNPKFCIKRADYGGEYFGMDEYERLPTASTCLNILRLPDYGDKEKLRWKLLYAIRAKSGFDLS